jgi:glutamate formiminotransferase/formiminotetrahydrofolate cyclodeaminase
LSYDDKNFVNDLITKGADIEAKTIALEKEIIEIANKKLGV